VAAYTAECRAALEDDQKPAPADRETMERVFAPNGVAKTAVYERAEPHREDPKAVERYCDTVRRGYTDTEQRRVDVRFAVAAQREDIPIHLGVQDRDGHRAIIQGPFPDPMGDMELTEDALRDAMYRTAGTPFRCEEVESVLGEGLRVSGLELDAARRRLLYALSEERAQPPQRKEGLFPAEPFSAAHPVVPGINFAVQSADQLTPQLAELRPGCVYVPLEILYREPDRVTPFLDQGCRIVAALPAAACGDSEERELRSMLAKVREQGVEQALTGNLGLALMASQEGFDLRGDMDLAVMNAYALEALSKAGFLSVTLSPELNLEQIRSMPKCADTELVVYGRLSAMVTETCLIKESAGRCACTTPGQMSDTHGGVWPVTKHFGCRNTVWTPKKIWLEDLTPQWISAGLWAVRLNFSTESPRECLDVANAYIRGDSYRPNGMTRGLYIRGVS
jgi:putative protease